MPVEGTCREHEVCLFEISGTCNTAFAGRGSIAHSCLWAAIFMHLELVYTVFLLSMLYLIHF